eukprot:SAG11_NODE_2571_length_3211_cov_4.163239_4_plen_112_part_00
MRANRSFSAYWHAAIRADCLVARCVSDASNSIIAEVRPGDQMSFFRWPTAQFGTSRYGGTVVPPLKVSQTERVTDTALLADAATLPTELAHHGPKLNPVSMRNTTVGWQVG